MEYNEKTLMTVDHLRILKFICSDVFQYKFVKILLWAALLVHVSATLITAYFMAYVLDSKEIIQYSSGFVFTTFLPILSLVVLLVKADLPSNLKNEMKMWIISSAGKKTHLRIKREIKLITAFAVIELIISLSAGVLFATSLSNDENIILVLRFSKGYSSCFKYAYKMTFPLVSYAMLTSSLQLLYYSQHVKFQGIMLNKYIANIADFEDGLNEMELFHNEEYQRKIRQRLISCIEKDNNLLRAISFKVRQINILIPMFSIATCLTGISIVLYFLSFEITSEYYPRMICTSAAVAASFCSLIWACQSVESHFENMFIVMNKVEWYNFNATNKTLYLIFMMNCMKERKIKFSENYSVNYKLGLAIVRGIYSVISVWMSMN